MSAQKSGKRKASSKAEVENSASEREQLATTGNTTETTVEATSQELKKKHRKTRNNNYTVCVPSTIVSPGNAKSLEQVTQVAYELAKAATIYNASEIVILDIPSEPIGDTNEESEGIVLKEGNKVKFNFDDNNDKKQKLQEQEHSKQQPRNNSVSSAKKLNNERSLTLATLLQYFVTPPYLVKSVIKDSKCLKYAKKYPTLLSLPFMVTNYLDNNETAGLFREGLSIAEKSSKPKHAPGTKVKKSKKKDRLAMTKYINVGLDEPLELAKEKVPVNVRVTVNVKERKIVTPAEAYYADKIGAKVAVGYHVRIAKQFSALFTESAFPDGYSSTVYVSSGEYFKKSAAEEEEDKEVKAVRKIPELTAITEKNANLLIAIGKKSDFYKSFKVDEAVNGVEDINEFFNHELKIPAPTRIEDAALISLTKLETI